MKGRNADVLVDWEDLQVRRDWLASRLAVCETLRDIVAGRSRIATVMLFTVLRAWISNFCDREIFGEAIDD